LANQALRRIGQPGAVGEIIAGLMLGPSLLGYALPGASGFHAMSPEKFWRAVPRRARFRDIR
jgi:Kef-type K+ transport system membrane component KefB